KAAKRVQRVDAARAKFARETRIEIINLRSSLLYKALNVPLMRIVLKQQRPFGGDQRGGERCSAPHRIIGTAIRIGANEFYAGRGNGNVAAKIREIGLEIV